MQQWHENNIVEGSYSSPNRRRGGKILITGTGSFINGIWHIDANHIQGPVQRNWSDENQENSMYQLR